jgi:hypothetical protein
MIDVTKALQLIFKTPDRAKQRGFSATRRPHNSKYLTSLHGEFRILDDLWAVAEPEIV